MLTNCAVLSALYFYVECVLESIRRPGGRKGLQENVCVIARIGYEFKHPKG